MKNLLKCATILLGIFAFIIGCSNPLTGNNETTTTTTITEIFVEENNEYYGGSVNFRLMKMIASNYLESMEESFDWKDAKIDNFYPIYNPATEKITYLEYKVTKYGKGKGYILVSLKEDEPNIVESSHIESKTCFELLKEKTKSDNIKVYRFSFDSYVALDKNSNSLSRGDKNGNKKVLSALGNIEFLLQKNQTNTLTRNNNLKIIDELFNEYNNRVKENGNFLDVKKTYVEEISKIKQISRGTPITHKENRTYEISWYCWYPLMRADQFGVNGYYSGCVPTSGAMIAAYWDLKKGIDVYPGTPTYESGSSGGNPYDNFRECVIKLREKLLMNNSTALNSALGNAFWWYAYDRGITPISYENHPADGIASSNASEGNLGNNNHFDKLGWALNNNWPGSLGYWEPKGGHSAPIYKLTIKVNSLNIYYNVTYSIATGWWNTYYKDIPAYSYACNDFVIMWR